jgi:hypothetical protein
MGQVSILEEGLNDSVLWYVIFPVFKKWKLDPFVLQNQFFMAILHLFSIKTA